MKALPPRPPRIKGGPKKAKFTTADSGRVFQPGDPGYHGPREKVQSASRHERAASSANLDERIKQSDSELRRLSRRSGGTLLAGAAIGGAAGALAPASMAVQERVDLNRRIKRTQAQRRKIAKARWNPRRPWHASDPGIRHAQRSKRGAYNVTGLDPSPRKGRLERIDDVGEKLWKKGINPAGVAVYGGGAAGAVLATPPSVMANRKRRAVDRTETAALRRERAAAKRASVTKADKDRKTSGALLATGGAAGVVATRHNAISANMNVRHQRKVDASIKRVSDSYGLDSRGRPAADPRKWRPKDSAGRTVYTGPADKRGKKAQATELVRNKHRELHRLRTTRSRPPLGGKARSVMAVGGTAVAVPALWGGARMSVDKADLRRRDVDSAVVGSAAAAGGYQGASYALKPLDRKSERKIAQSPDLSRKAKDYQASSGRPKNAKAGDPQWRSYFRNYPKDLPGGKLKRTLALTHTGRSGVAATIGAGLVGGAAAGSASQMGRRRSSSVDKALYQRERQRSPVRTAGALAGLGITAAGLGRSRMLGNALRMGSRKAFTSGNSDALQALQMASQLQGTLRRGTAPGVRAASQIRQIDELIRRVPPGLRGDVAAGAGMLLAGASTPTTRTTYRPVSYPVR